MVRKIFCETEASMPGDVHALVRAGKAERLVSYNLLAAIAHTLRLSLGCFFEDFGVAAFHEIQPVPGNQRRIFIASKSAFFRVDLRLAHGLFFASRDFDSPCKMNVFLVVAASALW